MGSVDKAVITGFICRLCTNINRFVVHIYGEQGVRLRLAHKINFYLPIKVSPHDSLPKTVCLRCIESLQTQHELMEQFKQARQRLVEARQERKQLTLGTSVPKAQPQGESSHSADMREETPFSHGADQEQSVCDNRVIEATSTK